MLNTGYICLFFDHIIQVYDLRISSQYLTSHKRQTVIVYVDNLQFAYGLLLKLYET